MSPFRHWEVSVLEYRNCVIANGSFRLGADLTLAAGSLTGVVGTSGSGKSTLLNAVAGFLPLASGSLHWQGRALENVPVAERPVAMIFQDNNLFPHLSASANVALARAGLSDDEVASALVSVGLDGMSKRRPGELSGGQQARVVLARTLLMARPILLLDEPFSALGPAQRSEMLGLVVDLAHKHDMTLLMVTHEPRDLLVLDQVVLIDAGRAAPAVARDVFLADPPEAWHSYVGT
jgi:thiamine transport system ATP-binding protein